MKNKRNEDRAGALRTGMWTATIVAVGALVCGLGGGALALSLPAAGSAQALPVYTSLNLVAEDEPVATVWQDFDPEDVISLSSFTVNDQIPLDLTGLPVSLYAALEQPSYLGLFWSGDFPDQELPWKTPTTDPGSAFYLYQVALPEGLAGVDQLTFEMVTCGPSVLDVGLRDDCISVRLSFPELEDASPARFEEVQTRLQEDLILLLTGRSTSLMGADLGTLAGGTWLEERVMFRPSDEWLAAVDAQEGTLEDRLMGLCESTFIDLQTIRLDNELLVLLSDRNGGGMVGVYCDVRLCCATGYVMQM